jgi:hypothetical protein
MNLRRKPRDYKWNLGEVGSFASLVTKGCVIHNVEDYRITSNFLCTLLNSDRLPRFCF